MISASFATVFSLCADVTLAIFAAALVFLALWRNPHRRSSQFFALSMFLWGLYGLINVPLHLAEPLELNYRAFFAFGAVVYAFALLATANFLLSFGGAPYMHWWGVRALGVALTVGFLALVARDAVFEEITPLPNGSYHYTISPLGLVGMLLGVLYLASVAALLRRSGVPRAKESTLPVFVMLLGLLSLTVAARFHFHHYSPNVLALTVSVVMLGRVVLKYHVFQPLEQLNAELERRSVELAEATQAKARFLANMSHDLRTPLNSILGYTRVFLAGAYGQPTEEQAERLQRILRNGQHLLEMINDVLDFSRIDAHQLELYRTRVETTRLLEALVEHFEPQARAKGVALVRGYGNLPAIHADEQRIHQVMRNLLSNALRHTQKGAIVVRGHYDALQERVVLSVTDSGSGIAPETQKRLFEPLLPLLEGAAEPSDGIGLGLFITKKLVELHGGRIWYESAEGQGSTFYVALPAHEIPPPQNAVLPPQRRQARPLSLIVVPEPERAQRLHRAFEEAHLHAYAVSCAHTALQLAHEVRPTLVVVAEALTCAPLGRVLMALAHDPATAHTPVLLLAQGARPLLPTLPNVRAWLPHDAPPESVLEKAQALLGALELTEAVP